MKARGKKELVKWPSVLPDKRDEADSAFLCQNMQSARRVLTIVFFSNALWDITQARFNLWSISYAALLLTYYNILIFKPSEAVTPQKHIRTHRLGEIYRGGNGLLAIDDEREDKQGQFAHGRECRDMDECALNIHDCALNSKSGFLILKNQEGSQVS